MDTSETYCKIKNCSKCGLEKHLYDFSIDHSVISGRRSYCKRCQSLYNIAHPHHMKKRTYKLSWFRKVEKGWEFESKIISCEPTVRNLRRELPKDAWLDFIRFEEVLK